MMIRKFLAGAVLCSLLAALAAGATPPAPARPPQRGVVRIRIEPAPPLPGAMRFLVDGVPRRAQFLRGVFVIRRVPAGDHLVSMQNSAEASGYHAPVSVAPNRTTDVGPVELQVGGELNGTVGRRPDPFAPETVPLAGVQVLAELDAPIPIDAGPAGPIPLPNPRPFTTFTVTTFTDTEGRYRFTELPQGAYRLSVVVPGLEAGVEFAYLENGQVLTYHFGLRDAIDAGVGTVRGRVTGPEGQPLEGALVSIAPDGVFYPLAVDAGSRARAASLHRADRALPGSLPRYDFSSLTDADGYYSLNVPSGYLRLFSFAEGYAEESRQLVLRARQTAVVDLRLAEPPPVLTGAVTGIVTDARTGRPLAGAEVAAQIAFIQGRADGQILPPPFPTSAKTDKSGRYRIEGLPSGPLGFSASRSGYRPLELTTTVPEGGETKLDFRLTPVRGKAR